MTLGITYDPAQFSLIVAIIQKYLPCSARSGPVIGETYAHQYAREIGIAYRLAGEPFGKAECELEWNELARIVRSALHAVEELSFNAHVNLILSSAHAQNERSPDGELMNAVETFVSGSRLILDGVPGAKARDRDAGITRSSPRTRRNWRAVGVAKACRRVWARALIDTDDHKWIKYKAEYLDDGRGITLSAINSKTQLAQFDLGASDAPRTAEADFLQEFAPVSEHQDAPGPFGRFVEDIFGALDILAADGLPVKAATALRSLKQVESRQ